METPLPANPLPPPENPPTAQELYIQVLVNKGFALAESFLPDDFELPEQLEMNLRADLISCGKQINSILNLLKEPNDCFCPLCEKMVLVKDVLPKIITYQEQFSILILSHELKQQERNRELAASMKRAQEEHEMNPNKRIKLHRWNYMSDEDSDVEVKVYVPK